MAFRSKILNLLMIPLFYTLTTFTDSGLYADSFNKEEILVPNSIQQLNYKKKNKEIKIYFYDSNFKIEDLLIPNFDAIDEEIKQKTLINNSEIPRKKVNLELHINNALFDLADFLNDDKIQKTQGIIDLLNLYINLNNFDLSNLLEDKVKDLDSSLYFISYLTKNEFYQLRDKIKNNIKDNYFKDVKSKNNKVYYPSFFINPQRNPNNIIEITSHLSVAQDYAEEFNTTRKKFKKEETKDIIYAITKVDFILEKTKNNDFNNIKGKQYNLDFKIKEIQTNYF